MENIQHYYVNISAPNLVVICIDENDSEERDGSIYHCYSSEPRKFSSIVELIRIMEEFFDDIAYPQASTMTRYFQHTEKKENVRYCKALPEKVAEQREQHDDGCGERIGDRRERRSGKTEHQFGLQVEQHGEDE